MKGFTHLLTPGNRIDELIVETYYKKGRNRLRVRPIAGQGVPTNMRVSCSLRDRDQYPPGTRFRCNDVIVMQKKGEQTVYLKVSKDLIYKI